MMLLAFVCWVENWSYHLVEVNLFLEKKIKKKLLILLIFYN